MLPHFNRALDRIRGLGTEQELAARLGISPDTLLRYRRGVLPTTIRKLIGFPALLIALAHDSSSSATRKRINKMRVRRSRTASG